MARLAEIELPHARVARDHIRDVLCQQCAADQHRDAVGEAEHEVHVVLDQTMVTSRGQRSDGLEQFAAFERGDACRRLVEQQHPRLGASASAISISLCLP